jgi:hypothetical protein
MKINRKVLLGKIPMSPGLRVFSIGNVSVVRGEAFGSAGNQDKTHNKIVRLQKIELSDEIKAKRAPV